MKKIVIGKHYTFDDRGVKSIMFVTKKDKYEGTNDWYIETITSCFGMLFEKVYDAIFFTHPDVKISTPEEVSEMRKMNKYNEEWIKEKIELFVPKYWGIDKRPNVVLDPMDDLETRYYGAYDIDTETVIFRSEYLGLFQEERVERILLHEICHWYLHVTGQNFCDRDVRFAEEIIRLGIEDTINFHDPSAKFAYEVALQFVE